MDGTPLRGAAPMFMIANEAVGGSWPGSPDASTQFPAQMKIDYIRAYAYSAPAGSTAPQPVTVGSGSDSLVVTVNEDAYQGDAQFTVSVDGVQVGGTQTTTALHASGQTQAFTFKGNWGTGQHAVAVNFLYDAYGGSAALDRNLYVTAMSYDGTNYPTNTAALTGAGPVSFTVGSATATTPQPVTVGSGSDSLVVTVNEDAYQGDAQFTVSVDGVQVGGTQTTTASHASGQTQAFTFKGNWGAGQHAVVVNFLYDAYGGSAALDRNLYVTAMSYDGTNYPSNTASLLASGPVSFIVGSATATTPQPITVGSGSDSLVVTVNEDAYQGDAQFTVSVDGAQVGGTQTTTASRASGQTQAFTFKGNWGTGQHTVVVNFLYDAWGGSAALDRNLYVTAMSYDGTNYPANTAALMAAGPATFTVGSAGTNTLTVTTGQTVTVPNGTYTVYMTGTSETVTAGTSGADTFVFNNTSPAVATIRGFKLGTDKVTTTTGLHDFANTSGGVDMRFDDGTHVTLAGVTNATAVVVMTSTINTMTVSSGQNVTTQPGFTDTVNIVGSGNATVNVNGNDTINCNTGTDTIRVSAGNVTVNGNTGTISFVGGGSGTATFNLKGGTTTATLGSGGATVNVAGKDTFTCGRGVETFNFTNDASIDTAVINSFAVGTDHLHLNGYGSGTTAGASITNTTGGVSIRLTDGSSIRLNGIATNTTLSQIFN
jgi:hypothetical protein